MQLRELLELTTRHAADFLERIDARTVAPTASIPGLRQALGGPLPEVGLPPERVIDELVAAVEPGLLASGGGRFFGGGSGGGGAGPGGPRRGPPRPGREK